MTQPVIYYEYTRTWIDEDGNECWEVITNRPKEQEPEEEQKE